jgi:hypothetical protein
LPINSGNMSEYKERGNMGFDHNEIKELFLKDAFIISNHARIRMFQRNISTDDIRSIIAYGEIIENET